MSGYILTGGSRKEVKSLQAIAGGAARTADKAYTLTGGMASLWYQRGTPLGSYAVGKTVKIAVGGKDYDWMVVHQGIPDAGIYDASCKGTWLLMKDIYTTGTFGINGSYRVSRIHSYLSSTFYDLIDPNIRAVIKQVKIPYQNGTGSGGSLATGATGLSTKVFLLSGYEVGWTTSDNMFFPKDGAKLNYFGSGFDGNSSRAAYNGGSPSGWWLRSPNTDSSYNIWYVQTNGDYGYNASRYEGGIRPCMILPQDALMDDTGRVIA